MVMFHVKHHLSWRSLGIWSLAVGMVASRACIGLTTSRPVCRCLGCALGGSARFSGADMSSVAVLLCEEVVVAVDLCFT